MDGTMAHLPEMNLGISSHNQPTGDLEWWIAGTSHKILSTATRILDLLDSEDVEVGHQAAFEAEAVQDMVGLAEVDMGHHQVAEAMDRPVEEHQWWEGAVDRHQDTIMGMVRHRDLEEHLHLVDHMVLMDGDHPMGNLRW